MDVAFKNKTQPLSKGNFVKGEERKGTAWHCFLQRGSPAVGSTWVEMETLKTWVEVKTLKENWEGQRHTAVVPTHGCWQLSPEVA